MLCNISAFSQSADRIMSNAAAYIAASNGISAEFLISAQGDSGSGVLKCSGDKFSVILPDAQVWFNGNELYTYNKRSAETTVTIPTADELAEVNPLEYVKNALKSYTATFATARQPGKYIVDLTPKSKSNEIGKISLTLNSGDYRLERLVISPKNGRPITVVVKNFKAGVNFALSEFEYPSKTLPNVEIIDLR